MQTVGRNRLVYTCRWCDVTYTIKINIQATDGNGKTHTEKTD